MVVDRYQYKSNTNKFLVQNCTSKLHLYCIGTGNPCGFQDLKKIAAAAACGKGEPNPTFPQIAATCTRYTKL